VLFIIGQSNAQVFKPVISFLENPISYSMHICSDGFYYYTVNGGGVGAKVGKIFVYTMEGKFIDSYPLELDMRSIIYNKKDKNLYVNTKDKKIFKILDIDDGTYELIYADLYENEQASLALDPKGKYLYVFDNGTLSKYKFSKGELIQTILGLKCGSDTRNGSCVVAVDGKYIYTWDAAKHTVYAYDKEGQFINSFVLSDGDFGCSLSFANGLIFVSQSKAKRVGKWYGYDFWGK
jgi:DNA-binding beta-propeller fold protein YncE